MTDEEFLLKMRGAKLKAVLEEMQRLMQKLTPAERQAVAACMVALYSG